MSASFRARRVRTQLGKRDLAILGSLREFRLMSGNQLRRLHFPGENRTTQGRKLRAAVQRLAELQLATRLPRRVGGIRSGSEGYIIGLTGFGQSVTDFDTGSIRRHRRVAQTKVAFQSHVLAVAELAVRLREDERAGLCQVEELAAEPGCWRSFSGSGGERRVLKPDLFMRLVVGDVELSGFCEIDLDSESVSTITRKLHVYVNYWRTGREQHEHGVFPRVWWLVPDRKRFDGITTAIRRIPEEARALFAVVLTDEAPDRLIQLPETGGRL